jgi:hypothetical protein
METVTRPNTFLQRLLGAAALDAAIYEEVEADPGATSQSMTVVVLSSLATGIGVTGLEHSVPSIAGVTFFTILAVMSWASWALVTFEVGSHVLPTPDTRVSVGQLLRTLGFAATPGAFSIFALVPGVAAPVLAGTAVWVLLAMIVAVRQALDYRSTSRAVAVCLLGWLLAMAFAVALGLMFGPRLS